MRGYSKNGVNLDVCAYCKVSLDEYSFTLDHLVPKSRGGKLSNSNKVPACGDCNKMKGDMSVTEFGRALNGLIFYEHTRHKQTISHLKKIKLNVDSLIVDRNLQSKK